jgi:uncharacterized protein YgiM (DUF1202 family)
MIYLSKTCVSMVASVCLLGFSYVAYAAEGTMITVGSKVSVRADAKSDAKVVETLGDKGTEVQTIGRSKQQQNVDQATDYWYQVKTAGGKTGWVFGGLVMEKGDRKTLGEGVMVRATASQKGSQVDKLAKGVTVQVSDRTKQSETIGKMQDYWYQVTANGKQGWVFGAFLLKAGKRMTTGKNVNVRDTPSVKGKPVESLGEKVVVTVVDRTKDREKIDDVQDYWYKVETASKKSGWVFGGFLMAVE